MRHRLLSALKWCGAISVLLLLGAALNVLVAWGFVCWTPPMPTTISPGAGWSVRVPEDWPPANSVESAARFGLTFRGAQGDNYAQVQQELSARLDALYVSARAVQGTMEETIRAYKEIDTESTRLYTETTYLSARAGTLSAGWPLPSICSERRWLYEYVSTGWQPVSPNRGGTEGGIRIPAWIPWCDHEQTDLRRLPTSIIPLGFAVNTVFYAGIITLIAWSYITLRRGLRVQAGCCTSCGYDLRGAPHTVCPECGTAPASATANAT